MLVDERVAAFKNGLASVKSAFSQKGTMHRDAFFSDLRLNSNPGSASGILPLLAKHGFSVEDNAFTLATNADRAGAVKGFLKDSFDILLSVFQLERGDLVHDPAAPAAGATGTTPPASRAIGLFTMTPEMLVDDVEEPARGEPALVSSDHAPVLEVTGLGDAVVECREIPAREVFPSGPESATTLVQAPWIPLDERPVGRPPLPVGMHGETRAAEELQYEYYVCSRCGAETSKTRIVYASGFLECPSCGFRYSKAEAQTVIKTPEEPRAKDAPVDVGSMHVPRADAGDALVRPSELFSSSPAPREASLVRPSELFGTQPATERAPGVQAFSMAGHEAGPAGRKRPVHGGDRLVRPSQWLSESVDAGDGAPVPAPPSLEEPDDMPATGPVDEHLVKPSEMFKQRQETRDTRDTCPSCGSSKYSKVQDRSKIISYSPLAYGYKKKCTACSREFD